MNVTERIEELLKQRNLSYYKLAQISEVPESTLNNMKARGSIPSLYTLERICHGLQISLSQFFMDDSENCQYLNKFQANFMKRFVLLPPEQQMLLYQIVENMV